MTKCFLGDRARGKVAGGPKITSIRLAAFDVDGTLLRGENICGCVGRHIGRSTEMDAFERLRSREDSDDAGMDRPSGG
jgi:hypothetical protein